MRNLVGTLPPEPSRGIPAAGREQRGSAVQFLREVRREWRYVTSPGLPELVAYSKATIVSAAATSAVVFALDAVFAKGLLSILAR